MNKRQLKKKHNHAGRYSVECVDRTLVEWSDMKTEWIDDKLLELCFNHLKTGRWKAGYNYFPTAKSARRAIKKIPDKVVLRRYGINTDKDKVFVYPAAPWLEKKKVFDSSLKLASLVKLTHSVYVYDSPEPGWRGDTVNLVRYEKNTLCFIVDFAFDKLISLVCFGEKKGWIETRFLTLFENEEQNCAAILR